MYEEIVSTVTSQFAATRTDLEDLVRIPSVSAPEYDPAEVVRSARAFSKR